MYSQSLYYVPFTTSLCYALGRKWIDRCGVGNVLALLLQLLFLVLQCLTGHLELLESTTSGS